MTPTQEIALIKTEKRDAGSNETVYHNHIQLWTPDGDLVVELCDVNECSTLEPPEDWP